jgi:tRNA pseudouridine(38-40) synthase
MKLCLPLGERQLFLTQLNSFLPRDIRAHCLTRVSKGFNSKMFCGRRRYRYLLPTYLLADVGTVNLALSQAMLLQGSVPGAGVEGGYVEQGSSGCLSAQSLQTLRHCPPPSGGVFRGHRVSEDTLSKLRAALKCFEGTNVFHNFTSGKASSDATAQRFVLSFDCGDPFLAPGGQGEGEGDIEWVLLSVLGQSFLLNQIRKMVCLAVEVARGAATNATIKAALSPKHKVTLTATVLTIRWFVHCFSSDGDPSCSRNGAVST